jgi:cytoskeletal protein CcmA (bactofilin family)
MPHPEVTENGSHSDDSIGPERPVPASVVSRGMTVTGNVMSQGDINIEGIVRGEVRGLHVWIRADGSVEGAIIANRVTIEGYMNGSVTADDIDLCHSARVDGDLYSEHLKIIKGARVLGRINPNQLSSSGLVATQTRSRVILSPPAPALPLLNPPTSTVNEEPQLAKPAVVKDQVRSNLQRRLAALAHIR